MQTRLCLYVTEVLVHCSSLLPFRAVRSNQARPRFETIGMRTQGSKYLLQILQGFLLRLQMRSSLDDIVRLVATSSTRAARNM